MAGSQCKVRCLKAFDPGVMAKAKPAFEKNSILPTHISCVSTKNCKMMAINAVKFPHFIKDSPT